MNARDTAMMLLNQYGCDLWCYADEYDNALKDINHVIAKEGRQFDVPAEDIAKELVKIAEENPKPEEPIKRFEMVFSTDSFCDGIDFETFEAAKADAEDTLINWATDERREWKTAEDGTPLPTAKQIENYDYMIYNCECHIVEYDDDGNQVNEYYFTDDELAEIGWIEWDELKAKLTKEGEKQ